jgi:hypothetical protein
MAASVFRWSNYDGAVTMFPESAMRFQPLKGSRLRGFKASGLR